MQISRLSHFSFGMPKISTATRELLPKHLSEQDKRNIAYVESVYPDAKLDVMVKDNKPAKKPIAKGIRAIERALRVNPDYSIDVYDFITPSSGSKPVRGFSINDNISLSRSDDNEIYLQSSYPVYSPNLTTEDLVNATNLYDKRYKKTMEQAKRGVF